MNLHLLDFLISSLTSRITSHWISSQAFENEQTPHSSLILAFTSLFCNLSRKRSANPGVASSSSVHEISRPKGISSSSNSSHSSVPSCRTRAREADSAMTDVASRRREATASSHIGSRADKASTPDRKPLEALKAAAAPGADAESAMTDVPCAGSRIDGALEALKAAAPGAKAVSAMKDSRGSRITGSETARNPRGSSTRSRSHFRADGRPFQRKPDHRIGRSARSSQGSCRSGSENDSARTDVARHRLDRAGTQRKPDRKVLEALKAAAGAKAAPDRNGSSKRKLYTARMDRATRTVGRGRETRKNTLNQ